MNSRQKGARGEREWAEVLRSNGFEARRGQQFSGGTDSPDVVCTELPFHFEVKRVESLNLQSACEQASRDSGGKPWVVAHKKNRTPWLITISAETFFQLLGR
jgi:Holliday junction resolvase